MSRACQVAINSPSCNSPSCGSSGTGAKRRSRMSGKPCTPSGGSPRPPLPRCCRVSSAMVSSPGGPPPQSPPYTYRAAVPDRGVQHSMVGALTERLFDGDVIALVQHLLTGEDVSPGDIAKIRDMIERVETNAPETK